MTSNYPTGLDSFSAKTDGVDDVLASHINDLQDAIEAVQGELGLSPSGGSATVRARLDALGSSVVAATLKYICNGRLTLESGVPVSTSDQTDKTNLYFTPYNGNYIALFDGTSTWSVNTFTELTLAVGGFTASKPYDIFIYDNAGTLTLSGEVWTNATTRATALTTQDGVYVKSGATNYRYLGTIYIDSGQKCQDTTTLRYLWNYYNQVRKPLHNRYSTNHIYTTAAWRPYGGSASYTKVEWITGIDQLIFIQCVFEAGGDANANGFMNIAIDTTNTEYGTMSRHHDSTANVFTSGVVSVAHNYFIGYHYGVAIQRTAAHSVTYSDAYMMSELKG